MKYSYQIQMSNLMSSIEVNNVHSNMVSSIPIKY